MAPAFNTAFKPRRFGQLVLRDLANGYKSLLVAMAAVAGSVILVSALTVLGRRLSGVNTGVWNFHPNMFTNLLFVGGFIVTSLAFREARQNGSGIFYLTLPASSLEKFASKLLTTSVGFAVGALVFFTAVAAASEGLNRLIFGFGNPFFNPVELGVLEAVGFYCIFQSIFLLGSVWWRKLAFVKTILSLQAVAVGIGLVAGVAFRIVFARYFHGAGIDMNDIPGWEALLQRTLAGEDVLAAIARVLRVVVLAATAPVCWVIGWLRLREIEV